MFALSLRTIRHRPGGFAATLLATFLGSAIVTTFNSMHDTAAGPGVADADAQALTLTAGVVGGYGSLLVFFAVASTLTVNVRQRAAELALLRSTGATPGQIKRMVVGEAAVVAVAGSLLALVPSMFAGRVLLDMFQDTGQVHDRVAYVFGPVGISSGAGITLLASVGAAFLAVRRATLALAGARRPRGRARIAGGCAALLAGAGGVGSTFALKPTDGALMAPAAYGSILLAVGFAVFSPALLRAQIGGRERLLTVLAGAGGQLTAATMRRRAEQQSGVLMPLILFTGIGTATLYMQAIENDAIKASGLVRSVDDKNLETINLVVVGVIVLFCCVMLINTLYASTTYRSQEFGRQRLAGATPGQVLGMVGLESLLLTVTGVFFGTVAGLAGILAFSQVRTGRLVPDQGPGIWLAVVAVAAAATLITGLGTTARVLRTPAVRAVAVAA
ncbi:FtsX-like permease family protein [Streptomyces sp. NPDC055078]